MTAAHDLLLPVALIVCCLGASGAKAATLVVTVQTATGKPVSGVGVRVLSGTGMPARAVSDDRGEVRFTAGEGTLQVIVDDPAHPPTTAYAVLEAGASQRVVLGLLDGTAVVGTVVDGAGGPIAGVAIQILPYGLTVPPDTTTDANGRFSSLLAEGSWRVRAAKPGKSDTWATLDIARGQAAASVTIPMPDAASLVVVTDCKSKGCLGASVSVGVANSGRTQSLDPDGTATFVHLPVGEAVVHLRDDKDPRHPLFGEAKIALAPAGMSRVSVTVSVLDARASVSGILVDHAGARATSREGGQLVVEAECHNFHRRAVAADDGTFTVLNVVPGECELTGIRIDPTDPMSGANGMRTVTHAVAPATGVRVTVTDFFRR